jgi:small subunit ribosomal protein S1
VVSLQGYGAFIDLGGLQGLLHVSEISHARISHPSEALQVGQRVKVKVLKVDAESGKVSLGMRQLEADPWQTVADRVRAGDRFEGKVTRVAEFGAFVAVEPGIEGLVHVSELALGGRGNDARKLVQAGDEMTVKVLAVDAEARRISLGRLDPDAIDETDVVLERGRVVKGKVDRVEPFGVFVRLGPGVTGLIPNEEMGTDRSADHKRNFPPGTPVEVEIQAVEDNGRRIRLSRASVLAQAERDELERYRSRDGSSGLTSLGDVLKEKLGPRKRG